jgi:DNA invertase Pin-like site-specific DNA recombinase
VSTGDQSVEPQLLQLRQYTEARGLDIAEEYLDEGVSGRKARRPALDRLLADAHRHQFDVVAVAKLDRLGRSLHPLLGVLGELEALGIDFVSIDDSIDTRTAAGRLFMQMRGAFAEYERALIVERTKAGLEAARRRGKRLGRPPVTDQRKRERIIRLRRNGHTIPQIADLVSVSRATVERVISSTRQPA